MGFDPFVGLALWWPGSTVVIMDSVHVYAGFLAYPLRCVDWEKPVVAAMLYRMAWARRLVCCMTAARVWLGSPVSGARFRKLWSTGPLEDAPLSQTAASAILRQGAAGLVVATPAWGHTLREAVRAAAHMCLVVKARHAFTWDHGHAQEENVILTHGDHIPFH